MKPSRRDLSLLLPALAAADASSQTKALPSRMYPFEDLVVKQNGENRSRAVLQGANRSGFAVEMHQTELSPGLAPHPPHRHVHEELLMIREGTMEVTISGKTAKMGPGSSAYVASNEEHGWRNVGTTRAHYFVLTLGREKA
ncbi:MAG: cupin domain-containing protein [Bryobacteraceae bacterium]